MGSDGWELTWYCIWIFATQRSALQRQPRLHGLVEVQKYMRISRDFFLFKRQTVCKCAAVLRVQKGHNTELHPEKFLYGMCLRGGFTLASFIEQTTGA